MTDRIGRLVWIICTVVVAIGLVILIALAAGSTRRKHLPLAPTAVVDKVSMVPASVFTRVGHGTTTVTPKAISAPHLTYGGKPEIVFIGAEYCAACATERWPVVIALSRFGTFMRLKTMHSSSTAEHPNTSTFSFHAAAYQSDYVTFAGVETQTNKLGSAGYPPLDHLTVAQQQLFDTYDVPPNATKRGEIPFIDFGGRYVVTGASYDTGVLDHKSASDIADALSDPTSAITKGAVGTANTFTAMICSMTGNEPARVCALPVVAQLEASLP